MQDLLKIEVIDNHSVATGLLRKGPVLDAGSRGLRMAKWFRDRGHQVIALDPGEDEKLEGVNTHKMALVHSAWAGGQVALAPMDDPEARYIEGQGGKSYGMSIPVLMHDYKITKWDYIKLNIEGSEYDILDEWYGPITRQLCVGFHEHTGRARGKAECDRIINKVGLWYNVYNRVWEKRYGCMESYWDVLFVLKGIE